jgi:HEAT repeat protein
MKKPDPVEQALDRLSSLRSDAELSTAAIQELKTFLKGKSNQVVAKAARIAGELHASDLIDDLVAAFHRLMANPQKLDKGCAATTEIAAALYQMDYLEPEIYVLGIHHVQMEGSFGPPVDVAAKLRAHSALGLARTRHPQALEEIVPLLVDPWPQARIGAVRALASNGGHAGALLLRLKVLTGEDELDVLAECFSGLLECAPESSLSLVATYINAEDHAAAEAALLAIGSSRLPEALTLLQARWEESAFSPLRRTLLLAIAMVRSEAAIKFILSLLPDSNVQTAKEIITALAIFRDNNKVRLTVEQTISTRNDSVLTAAFRQEF